MLRRFLAVAFWTASLAAAAGESTPTIREIQNTAVGQCSFLPTAPTVSAILAKNNPTPQTEAQVVSAVCAAVDAKSNKRAPPVVDGVVIRGCRVRRRRWTIAIRADARRAGHDQAKTRSRLSRCYSVGGDP